MPRKGKLWVIQLFKQKAKTHENSWNSKSIIVDCITKSQKSPTLWLTSCPVKLTINLQNFRQCTILDVFERSIFSRKIMKCNIIEERL